MTPYPRGAARIVIMGYRCLTEEGEGEGQGTCPNCSPISKSLYLKPRWEMVLGTAALVENVWYEK